MIKVHKSLILVIIYVYVTTHKKIKNKNKVLHDESSQNYTHNNNSKVANVFENAIVARLFQVA